MLSHYKLPSRGKPVFPSKNPNPCAILTLSYDSVHSIEEFNYIRGTVEEFKSISSSAEMDVTQRELEKFPLSRSSLRSISCGVVVAVLFPDMWRRKGEEMFS